MKNRMIELERFVAACLILLYHLKVVEAGWIFVEFFFILTGYFLMQHLESHKEEIEKHAVWYPLQYTFKKYLKLLPYAGASIIAMWFAFVRDWNLSGVGILKWLLYLPCDLLLLGGSGMLPYGHVFHEALTTPRMMNVLLWYVCSMLIVMPFVIYLLLHKKKARGLLCSVIPAVLYGFLIMRDGRVDGWHDQNFGFVYCNIRAAAGLLLGAGVWHVSKWWKRRTYTTLGKSILTAVEVLSFVTVAVVSSVTDAPYDSLEIGLLALSVSLTTSGVTYTAGIGGKLFGVLGSWSLAIYCLQEPIMHFGRGRFGAYSNAVIFVATIVAGAVFTFLVTKVQKWYKTRKGKLKRLIVKE